MKIPWAAKIVLAKAPPIKTASAALTCRNIVRRLFPGDPVQRTLEKIALNSNPAEEEEPGLINQILDGKIFIQDQISPAEVGNIGNIVEGSSNSGTGYIRFAPGSRYSGSAHQRWRLKIDTAGAPGTATWKLSFDAGTNYDLTLQVTFNEDSNDRRIYLAQGIYVVFWGTFTTDDQWDFDLFPGTDEVSRPMITSTLMVRG